MTANEMADDLERAADRVASFGSPGYEDSDLTEILTEAESLYVKKFLNGKNNRLGESFDETEVRKQGLSALVKRGSILTTSSSQVGIVPNGKFFDLPTDQPQYKRSAESAPPRPTRQPWPQPRDEPCFCDMV